MAGPNSDHSAIERKHEPVLFGPGSSQKERDSIIWASFKSGNKDAVNFIFNTHVKALCVYGEKIARDKALVQDCVQDLFVDLWRRREMLGDTDSIKFYLFKSLRRNIIRKLGNDAKFTRKKVEDLDHPFAIEFSFEEKLISDQFSEERRHRLSMALEKLSNRQREAIYLKFYQKLSSPEIAETMNIDVASCYNLVSRAVDALRDALKTSRSLFI